MDFVKEAYKVKSETIIKNLKKRFMDGYYADTKEEAVKLVMSLIGHDDIVSWGGSLTIDELGVKKLLEKKGISVIDREKAKSPEERVKFMKQALTANVFLTSTNAITMDGELMNVDGNGNRVAAYCYGPDSVIVVAGMNKVVPKLDYALAKLRTDATVPNAVRFNAQTPCRFTGKCSECTTKDTLCSQILITRFCKPQNRIKVILVGEHLGF
ncbi:MULTISPECIES: lactate utilization protein [unclassified Sedimentibacter]|uniref:lactate utilization protein n=1 Tax=unclassified Sedimentibacter TaxID=2649220 RepID=UPI0027E0C0C2|nr:lactate utilization protein [Sedimentibacter sp. MB35-C1]WMJ76801.1 lactate utilization protein [Sedimentibacter sp. MB35-C1]